MKKFAIFTNRQQRAEEGVSNSLFVRVCFYIV